MLHPSYPSAYLLLLLLYLWWSLLHSVSHLHSGFLFQRCCRKPSCTHQNIQDRRKITWSFAFLFICSAFCSLSTSEKFALWASWECGTDPSILEALQLSHRSPQFVSVLYSLSPSTSALVCLSSGKATPWTG